MKRDESADGFAPPRRYEVSRYNRRMAQRIARRAKLHEDAVAVAFTFNNLVTMCIFGVAQDIARFIPFVGAYIEMAVSLLSFYFHRIVIVTGESVFVYRDLPFHFPTKRIAVYPRGAGLVRLGSPNPASGFSRFIRRGQLTFEDGLTAYHGFIWIRRAQYIEQEANLPAGG
jgi:hypothetical protein